MRPWFVDLVVTVWLAAAVGTSCPPPLVTWLLQLWKWERPRSLGLSKPLLVLRVPSTRSTGPFLHASSDGGSLPYETMEALGPLHELCILPSIPFLLLFMPVPLFHFNVALNAPFLERPLLATRTPVTSSPPVTVLPLV